MPDWSPTCQHRGNRIFTCESGSVRQVVQRHKRELGKKLGFDYSGFTDAQVSDIWQYDIFPNTFMTIQAEEVWIYGPRPDPTDVDKCFFDKWTLQHFHDWVAACLAS